MEMTVLICLGWGTPLNINPPQVCKRNEKKKERDGGRGMKRGGEKRQGARMKGRAEGMEEWKGRAESRKPKEELGEKKGRQGRMEGIRRRKEGRGGRETYTHVLALCWSYI